MVLRATATLNRLVGLVVKASASTAADPGVDSRLRREFVGPSHTSDSNIGTPLATLPGASEDQRWEYLVRCQHTVTGWDKKFDLQLLSQCGSTCSCLSRSVLEIHSHVAGTLSKQATSKQTATLKEYLMKGSQTGARGDRIIDLRYLYVEIEL